MATETAKRQTIQATDACHSLIEQNKHCDTLPTNQQTGNFHNDPWCHGQCGKWCGLGWHHHCVAHFKHCCKPQTAPRVLTAELIQVQGTMDATPSCQLAGWQAGTASASGKCTWSLVVESSTLCCSAPIVSQAGTYCYTTFEIIAAGCSQHAARLLLSSTTLCSTL